ncbi:type VII secretion integral membrane protein EccD [Streptomyces kunmingensis]|uniref:Type VII secretion integral membrane protein EccD n=1 Tax=Streptomyces kunmingensis TaxID=68225 RepID=A0ABU6CE54_9ACTN|nr:type VII secretion integral membrane protein EccD [Streptomyces kunmingensis]MEB3962995.1 type VII secretion integral membrane protein EccD [Streptomyces kunmingensis]
MSESSAAGLCRLTIRAPSKSLDLAVPADIPFADMLPVIVEHAGEDLNETGIEHGGWILQRIGGDPLDGDATPDALDLRDGEMLLLRPGTEALPSIRYDNLVDAVSTTMRQLPHAWDPGVSRWVLRAAAAVCLLGCLIMLALPGDRAPRIAVSVGATLIVLAAAGAAGRVLGDRTGAVLLGLFSSCFLALGGVLVVGDPLVAPHTHRTAGAELLAGSVAGAIGTALALTVVATFSVVFTTMGLAFAASAVGGALMIALDRPFSAAAAGVVAVSMIFSAFVPMLSFKLAGLKLPPLPTNAEQLQEGIEPHSTEEISERARATDHWMSGLYTAVGIACVASLIGMARDPGTPQKVTSGLLVLLLVLHCRNHGTAWHRIALTAPAVLGAALVVAEMTDDRGPIAHLAAAATLLLFTVALTLIAWSVPGRRLLPHWGRAGDLLQSATAVALLPIILWTLGVYQELRAVNG